MTPVSIGDWIGRTQETTDIATAGPLQRLAATLDHVEPPWRVNEVPPLGHWLYFLPNHLQRDIAEDGHALRGLFLSPVDLPRRMWAGSRVTFHAPIHVNDRLRQRSTVTNIDTKSGRSGTLIFVTVTHEVATHLGLALTELQDIVYREAASESGKASPSVAPESTQADWARTFVPNGPLLFRYSALTFNAHRIHYDRGYACDAEGYQGLVVHAPLAATFLLDLYLRQYPGHRVSSFSFRAHMPLVDRGEVTLRGRAQPGGADLWALDQLGGVAMTARVTSA